MEKISFAVYILLFLSFCDISICAFKTDGYMLQQVLILSRHNLRTPLDKNLASVTPKKWPKWKEESGYLTAKGAELEGYMGDYFSQWITEAELLPKGCPSEETIFIYSDIKQRTMASTQAFIDKGFPNCNITIHHSKNNVDMLFEPVIHNISAVFHDLAVNLMKEKLKSLSLKKPLSDLEELLDYKESNICLLHKKCDLNKDVNVIKVIPGKKPNIDGPLKISNSVINSFLMQYYEGFSNENVAWGQLETDEKWRNLIDISRGYHNIIFNSTLIAHDVASPLIELIVKILLHQKPKFTLLMGHDSNLYTVLNGMNFLPYSLPFQNELTPVGSKIVFQKWMDQRDGTVMLRINLIYQSTSQLRNGDKLSMSNPPKSVVLKLRGCPLIKNGFCLLSDFKKLFIY